MQRWYPEWIVSFEIKPFGTVSGWSNILHLTADNNVATYGDRVPSLWFHSGTTKLHICSAINGNKNYCINPVSALALNAWTQIEITQYRNYNGDYEYQVKVGNGFTWSVVNTDPQEFTDVTVFTSDPWHPPAAAVIRKLHIDTKQRRLCHLTPL